LKVISFLTTHVKSRQSCLFSRQIPKFLKGSSYLNVNN
jgi:hypothetical protein